MPCSLPICTVCPWTNESIHDAVQQFIIDHGKVPSLTDFKKRGLPPHPVIKQKYGITLAEWLKVNYPTNPPVEDLQSITEDFIQQYHQIKPFSSDCYNKLRKKGSLSWITIAKRYKVTSWHGLIDTLGLPYIDEKMPPQKIAERFGFSGDSSIRQILKRKSSTGCITLKGEEFHGNHVPIIPLEVWEAAQNELQRRSSHRTDSSYLLSGLIYCGECGAKMRYQSWGQYGVKIYCYSQQKSKPSLVKDENCNNEKYWSEDVENAVIEEMFKFNYLGNKENQKISSNFDVKALLTKELNAAKKQLSRLYDFDTDDEDDVIKDKIKECRTKVKNLTTQINNEEQRLSIQRNVQKAKNILCNLEDTWPHMTEKEKQTVCQELIDRITIFKNGTIDVHLKLQNYLIKHENEE